MTECTANSPSLKLDIWYCGHGSVDCSLDIYDADLSYSEFASILEPLPKLPFTKHSTFTLFINCCYAAQFAYNVISSLKQKQIDDTVITPTLETIKLFSPWMTKICKKTINLDKLKSSMENRPCATLCDKPVNASWAKAIMEIINFRTEIQPLSYTVESFKFVMFPLSLGEIALEGALNEEKSSGFPDLSRGKGSGARKRKLHELQPDSFFPDNYVGLPEALDSPKIFRFKAGRGDSTLIRYRGIDILVDGGEFVNSKICFWPYVQKADLVILTHGDGDNISGFLPLLFSTDHTIENFTSKVISHYFQSPQAPFSSWSRTWFEAAAFAKICEEKDVIVKDWNLNPFVIDTVPSVKIEVKVLFPKPALVQGE